MSLIPPIKYAAEFKEQQHPRDQGGQFTSGGGGGGAQEEKKSSTSTSTPEFRGEWSDYTKTTAENVYGEVVDKFPSLRTTFQGLQTEGAGKYGGEAGFDAFGHTIRLDASSAKKSETQELDRQFDRAAKTVGAIEAGYRGWLIHEFGHAIDHSIINGIAESEKDEYFEAKKSLVDRLDAPSEYGSTSRGEWVAERFLLESTGGAEPTLTEFLSEWSERAEGKPATDKPTSTPEFKAWFGNSKVVDEAGEPLVVYHGTDKDFDAFKKTKGVHRVLFSTFEVDREGFYFTPDSEVANSFGENVIPSYLSIQNPADIFSESTATSRASWEKIRGDLIGRGFNERWLDKTDSWEMFDEEDGKEFVDALRSMGYDGAIIEEPSVEGEREQGISYIAFDPTQIKSATGNKGSFDPDDPRINYSKWNESDHPRDDDGKFGSGGGGKAVDDDDEWEARQREKTEKRAAASEAAVQRRQPIRDAFRSVKSLGGGHNLSTIEGWRSYITASFNSLDKAFPGVFTHNQIAKLHQQDEMSYKGRKFKFGTNLDREDYLQAVIEDKAPDLLESSPTKSNPIKAAGFTPDSRQKWRKNNRVAQRQTQTPQVGSAAAKLNSGGVSQDEYLATVKEHRPIKPLTEVPEIPTFKEIVGALDESKLARGIVGLTPVKTPDGSGELKDGDKVAARLDIPAYDHYDTWVVSLHDGSKKGGGSIGYAQTSVLDNVEFVSSPRAALNIGMGKKDKQPFARMHGDWKTHSPQDARARAVTYMDHPDWKQVGMNPFRHSWFYDKDDGKPIVGAEQVIQIGALVLAKNVKYAPVDDDRFAFTNEKGETSHYAKWEESKHPRDESGRFGSGGGGADKPKKQNALEMIEQILSGGKPKMQTAEEKEVEEKEKATNEVLKNEGFEDTEDTVDYWLDPDHAEDFYDLDLDQRVALVRASYSDDNSGDDQLLGFDISREFIAKDDTLYGIAKDLLDDGRDLNGAEYEPGQPMGIEYEDELGHYEPPSEPDLTEYLMNKYPEGHNWDEAGFLTNDGRLASMGQYGSRGEDHRSALPTEEAMERWGWSKESRDNRTVALWEMGIRSGHIRVHVAGGDMSLEVYGPLTSDQKIALGDFFRDVGPSSVAIDVTGKTGPVAGSMLDYPSVAELDAYIDSALEEKGDYYSRRQPVQRYTKFDESKHPRDESGKFGEGGGGADEPPFQLEQQKKKTGRPPKMFTPQEKEQMVLFRGKDELPGQTDWIEQQEERERASEEKQEPEGQLRAKAGGTSKPDWSQYTGVSINSHSRKKLVDSLASEIPDGWTIYAHHMTMHAGAGEADAAGSTHELKVTHWGKNDTTIAVRVEGGPDSIADHKHITVAVSPDGVAKDSNKITEWHAVEPMGLSGAVETMQGKDTSYQQQHIAGVPFKPKKSSPTSSPEFKNWFGDSKVVDKQGEPLVVHHGSIEKNLTRFDPRHTVEVEGAFFFSSDEDVASDYTYERAYGDIVGDEPMGEVISTYLSFQNPLEYRGGNIYGVTKPDQKIVDAVEMGKAIEMAKAKGHDSLIIRNIDDTVSQSGHLSDVYVAFDPTQIKSSSGNQGSFDPEDPRINYSMLTEEGHKASLYEEKIAQYAAKREQKEWYGRAWKEAQHQRDESGQFTSGSGSSALQQARGAAGRPTEAGVVHTGTQVPEREQTRVQQAKQRYPQAKPVQFDPGGSIYYEPVRNHEYTGAPLAHGEAPLWLLSPEITTVEMELAGGRTSAIERRKNMGHPPTFNDMGMPVFDAQMHPSAISSGSGSMYRSPAGYSRLAGMFHAEYYARQMTLWNEPDHPRDKDGQFTSGSGQEKKPEEEKKPEPEPEPETTEVKFKVRGHGEWVWDGTEKQHGIRKDRLITQVGTGQKAWLMLYDGGYRIAKPNAEGERPGFWDARKNTIAKGKKNPLDAAIKEGSRTKERAGRFTDVEGELARMVLVGMFDLSLQKMMQQANSVPEANRAQATYDRMSEILPRVVSKLGTKAARLAGKLQSITIYRDVHQLREGRGTSSGVLGYYRYSAHSDDSGELHLTAEGIPESDQEDVVAHEFCHAVDGPRNVYSDNPEWKRVWKKEIGSRRAMHAVWGGGKEGWCKGTKLGDVKAGDVVRDGREWKTVAETEEGFVGRKKTMRIKWEGEQDFEHYKRLAYVMVEGNEPLPEPPLTAYAQLKASEGFAEFGAQVVRDADGAKEKFPACYALWEKWGLVE